MSPQTVKHLSDCFIKPNHLSEEAKKPVYLGAWDLLMLSVQYIQKGLLFQKPDNQENPIDSLINKLKNSLAETLVYFYPLAGRLATMKQENPHSYVVFIDCNNSPGARFIHAKVDLKVSDILSPTDVPLVVQSFFDHDRAVNHDGHTMSLLTIQVTELIDGIFIGCSINHAAVDGTSYWHFFNSFSQVFNAKHMSGGKTPISISISRPPVHEHWFPDGYGPSLSLPFTHHDQFITRQDSSLLRERIFHFSAAALARVKARANNMEGKCNNRISTLQALSALIWRCVTRVRRLPNDQITGCRMAVNNRSRLDPPLSENYFGNAIQTVRGISSAGELLGNKFGWAALLLNEAVASHNDKSVREFVAKWVKSPFTYQISQLFDPFSIMMGSSPRFEMYGNEFGLGKALAIRSGYAHKFDGKVTLYPGREGAGSMDLEMCLFPDHMSSIDCDEEFLDAINFT